MWKEDKKIDACVTFAAALALAGFLVLNPEFPSGVGLLGGVAMVALMFYSFSRARS